MTKQCAILHSHMVVGYTVLYISNRYIWTKVSKLQTDQFSTEWPGVAGQVWQLAPRISHRVHQRDVIPGLLQASLPALGFAVAVVVNAADLAVQCYSRQRKVASDIPLPRFHYDIQENSLKFFFTLLRTANVALTVAGTILIINAPFLSGFAIKLNAPLVSMYVCKCARYCKFVYVQYNILLAKMRCTNKSQENEQQHQHQQLLNL